MICPKCGFEQPQANDCTACGIIIAKYLARASGVSQPVRPRKKSKVRYSFLQKERELAAFYDGQATMLGAGLNQRDAINKFLGEPGKIKDLTPYLRVKETLATGATVSEAMNKAPEYFPVHHSRLVAAAELAGDPSVMFAELKRVTEQKADTLQTIVSETRKPVITVLLSFFLLPLPVLVSDGVGTYLLQSAGPLLLIALAWFGGGVLWRNITKAPDKALAADKLKFNFALYRQYLVNQYLQVFTLLYAAGVPVKDAMTNAGDATDNRFFKRALKATIDHLQNGDSLTVAMKASNVFDSKCLSIIATGEASGSLTNALNSYLARERSDFDVQLKRWTKVLTITAGILISLYVGARIILGFMASMPDIPDIPL